MNDDDDLEPFLVDVPSLTVYGDYDDEEPIGVILGPDGGVLSEVFEDRPCFGFCACH